MELNIVNLDDQKVLSSLSIPEEIFNKEFNEPLVHQIVVAYQAAARAGTRAQKTRSEVAGSGAKPWRQKGLGRARSGTKQSPIWRSGGVAFAAKPQNHAQKVNKKMYKGAIRSIFSELIRKERLLVVDSINLKSYKTKELLAKLNAINLTDVLIITEVVNDDLYFASRNLYNVNVCDTLSIDPVSLIGHSHILITAEALKQLGEMLK